MVDSYKQGEAANKGYAEYIQERESGIKHN